MNYRNFLNKYIDENGDCYEYLNFDEDRFTDEVKFNTDVNVDYLADSFITLYLKSLVKDRLFAKQSQWNEIVFDYFELNAFKSHFKSYFKTAKQYRKTKHILSDTFTFRAKDMMGYLHTYYFCVDKKEFDKRGNDYLEELQFYLIAQIESKKEKAKEERAKMEAEEIDEIEELRD